MSRPIKPIRSVVIPSRLRPLAILPILALAGGCSPAEWSDRADREVYGILKEKQLTLFGEVIEFDIETPHSESDPKEIEAIEIISDRRRDPAREINLDDALGLAVENRRDYRSEKENLYLTALDLTRARHDFRPRADAGSTVEHTTDTIDGTAATPRQTDQSAGARNRAGFDRLLKSGGSLAVDLAQDILRLYSGGGAPSTTFLSAGLVQPLIRGRSLVATENLTQSERDVIYAIRSFSRFEKRTALDVINAYLRILEEKDRVRNEYSNYRNLIAFTERATELARDRLPRFQVDQARQDELRARNRYIVAVNSYRSSIDSFKLFLGLPVGGEFFIDDGVLRDIERAGLTPVALDSDVAFAIAIDHRLDLRNEIGRFEDAKRRLEVAADAFKPGLDLFAGIDLRSDGTRRGRTRYSNFDADAYRTSLGIDLDLPVDNLEARNSFRRARIDFERQLRDLELALDRIHAEVRDDLRGLELARQSFEIQRSALEIANRRVESVNLLLDADRAETRDLLEAQNDQLGARNSLTSALIDYHLTRLELLHGLGAFEPGSPDFWSENPDISETHDKSGDSGPVEPEAELVSPPELFRESESLQLNRESP
jgi:outer membrane protein TolC